MDHLNQHQVMVVFLSLGVLLGVARILGELAQRFNQPAILGELLAGILLGPTVLGSLAPGCFTFLFPATGPNAVVLDAVATIAIVLFLMVAGIEVDLSTIWRQGRAGSKIGLSSIAIPFAFGFSIAWLLPQPLGRQADVAPLIFSLFFAVAISISALPIIAKTLMDMDLYRSDLGMVVISAAIFNDLVGWIVFAVILGLMGGTPGAGNSILATIGWTLAFAGGMLTVGRWLIHKALPYIQAHTRRPGGELSFALVLAMFGAAFTEWIGIHAILGAFLVGAAVGDSAHLRERTRVTMNSFISFFFAPVFFASIGLKIDFLEHFDLPLVLTVLVVALTCKLAGAVIGARWGNVAPRESWAAGFAMVSVGAMGIIIGLLALNAGIIDERLFVALVVMAMATSMLSGPIMRLILGHARKRRLPDVLTARLFIRDLHADSRREAIHEMTRVVCDAANLDAASVEKKVWAREEAMSTGIGNGVALPHARIDGLAEPLVAVGFSDAGIDFDAPDGHPANVLFLVLTPVGDAGAQLEIAAEIARIFRDPRMLDRVLRIKTFTDFLALLKSDAAGAETV